MTWSTGTSPTDWTAGIPAGMSAKHEKKIMVRRCRRLTPLKNAALQAGMPAVQSLDDAQFRFHVKCFLIVTAIFSKSAIVLPTVVDSPSFFTSVIPVFASERTDLISSQVALNFR